MTKKYYIIFPLFVFSLIIFLPLRHACSAVYEVGPQKKYEKIAQVPFDSLEPGDTVSITIEKNPIKQNSFYDDLAQKNSQLSSPESLTRESFLLLTGVLPYNFKRNFGPRPGDG